MKRDRVSILPHTSYAMLTLSRSVLATARTSSDRKTMHMLHGSFQVSPDVGIRFITSLFRTLTVIEFVSWSGDPAALGGLNSLQSSSAKIAQAGLPGDIDVTSFVCCFLEVVFWTSGKKLPTNVVMNGKIHFGIPTMSRNCYWHGEREREREK